MHPLFTEALARDRIDGYRRVAHGRRARAPRRSWRRLVGRALIRVGTRLSPPPAPVPRTPWSLAVTRPVRPGDVPAPARSAEDRLVR